MKLREILLWFATALLLFGAVWLVPLNQDEGWYLLAARRVAHGQMPYRDFTFTQGPILPFLYALATPLVRATGILGGRLIQLLITLGTLAVLRRNVDRRDLLLLLALFCIPFHLQFSLIVKTYALAGLFLTLGVHFWFRQSTRSLMLSSLFLALAAATRISLLIVFVPFCISLLDRSPGRPSKGLPAFALTAAATLLLLYGPFFLQNFESARFQLLDFHQARQPAPGLLFRAGIFLRWIQAWLPALLVALLIRRPRFCCADRAVLLALLGAAALHLLTPFPYEEYQTPLYPAFLLLFFRHANPETLRPHANKLVFAILLFSLSSPRLHQWLPVESDRLWHSLHTESDLQHLRRVARKLNESAPENALLFTPDSYLAIETGLDVPPGLEMGPFSFSYNGTRPELLDKPRMLDRIHQSDILAFTPYLFVNSPAILPMTPQQEREIRQRIEQDFQHAWTEPNFGQGRMDLEVWIRKP